MKRRFKSIQGSSIELGEASGSFKAIFSKFNVIDRDGDVTLPNAIKDNTPVRIAYWGHRWKDLPVGQGIVHTDNEHAWVEGQFFTDTTHGNDTYKTVKYLSEAGLQEWSYGFDVLEAEPGVHEGKKVNILKSLDVFEVSPVLLGAGIGTRTESIKSQEDDDEPYCSSEGCKSPADVFVSVCLDHFKADTVTWAKAIKQALTSCDEEVVEALIKELTPVVPEPKVRVHQLIAALSEARADSHFWRAQ